MKYDLVIIGAGPAGMCAAIQAASNGARVALVDENPVPGGKLRGQVYKEPKSDWWIGEKIVRSMESKIKQLGVTCFLEREVWGIYPKWKVMLNNGEQLESDFVLIATGAAEKAIPIPGWTTPGVMAIGAAQVLANIQRVKPGNRVAIIGIDALSLTIAYDLKMAGVNVVGIYLPPLNAFSLEKSNPLKMIAYLSSLSHLAPNPMLKLLGKLGQIESVQKLGVNYYPPFGMKVWGIPLHLRKAVVEIIGNEAVEEIVVAAVDQNGQLGRKQEKRIPVDCACISGGLYPLVELANAAGCESVYIEELGGHIPLYNEELETTQSGIFVAGNSTGIEGAKVAMAQGELVGTVISIRLGFVEGGPELIKKAKEKVNLERENAVIKFHPGLENGRAKLERLSRIRE
ncbi:NAD(P)/FAD-dependent oxidoreductase [Oceanobacillus polygoni]|uniref:Sarcosine oxidase subunit alpha n=1 Tax=Oceanobacillus polygoni TaxID=1235259 RepID=A0A9X1CJW2_9BACI|nr:NAD(P)/FAD-dependent oxidoreductase [Oceanobacillus polygoni]MBP2079258.1 sarcosine oxidase subunit alpha [Oceanobacillus polygoni]